MWMEFLARLYPKRYAMHCQKTRCPLIRRRGSPCLLHWLAATHRLDAALTTCLIPATTADRTHKYLVRHFVPTHVHNPFGSPRAYGSILLDGKRDTPMQPNTSRHAGSHFHRIALLGGY